VAANNAIDNIKALHDPSVKYIVSACPSCTTALVKDFTEVLQSKHSLGFRRVTAAARV
jgi:Fe-S oxidoreductase